TGALEGVNNKIKVIKRKAYGFHDIRYFILKIYQAFYN
ncbi:MAG: transposase, partial [Pseudomonadota bacterium]